MNLNLASFKKTITLKNLFIDSSDPVSLQEIDKEETRFYNLQDILKPFYDTEGVSITITNAENIPSDAE